MDEPAVSEDFVPNGLTKVQILVGIEEVTNFTTASCSQITALVTSGSSVPTRYRYHNGQWDLESDEITEVDQPIDWVAYDQKEREEHEAKLENLQIAQRICTKSSNPAFRAALQNVIDEEKAKLDNKVLAP